MHPPEDWSLRDGHVQLLCNKIWIYHLFTLTILMLTIIIWHYKFVYTGLLALNSLTMFFYLWDWEKHVSHGKFISYFQGDREI